MARNLSHEKPVRGPAAVNGTLALAVLVLVAVVALPTTQSPPPAIAEFSPQAQEQITEAPESQSSDFGEGPGGAGTGTATTTTTTLPPGVTTTTVAPIERARLHRCVGDPPRQTEDPQSPPCVAFWEGDNGGATSKGVTADEIRVVVPTNDKYMEALASHFNSRFEFYGRKIRVFDLDGPEGDMVGAAIMADEEFDAFASLSYNADNGHEFVYYDELARRGIIGVNGRPVMADESHLARFHPYQWSYLPGFDVISRNKAEWACTALKDRPAEFADGAQASQPRTFARVTTILADGTAPDLGPMDAVLDACGIELAADETIVHQQGENSSIQAGQQEAQEIVSKLFLAGVTTVLCMCHTQASGLHLATAATSRSYFPEWLVSTYMHQAEDLHIQTWDPSQMENTFGQQWWSKQQPREESPWFWAVKDGDPDAPFENHFDNYEARWEYHAFLVLASGIQMAGPNLTPETFGEGLQKARFPNPGAGAAPWYQGRVGFEGDHTFVDDAALIWGGRSQPSNWGDQVGAICYANRGVRYRLGTWPTDNAGLFEGPCY